jgi:hypothetical protein
MKGTSFVVGLATFVIFVLTASPAATQGMAPYSAQIEYKETITTIVDDQDTTTVWPLPGGTTLYRGFSTLAASGDGSKVVFRVCDLHSGGEGCRVLLANADGSSLEDISAIFPPNIVSTAWSWGNLRINDDGSKVFIRAQLDDGKSYICEYDVGTGGTGTATGDWWWSSQFDWFDIDDDASRFFVGKHDEGFDPIAGRNIRGLYWSDYGSTRLQYVDIYADLPCNGSCNNLNMVTQLGGSADGDRAFFTWMSDYLGNGHPDNRSAMWMSVLPHTVSKVTADDHYWVWEGDERGVCDQSGGKVLYQYRHLSGDPKITDLVDVATGTSTQLTWTTGLNPVNAFITRSGEYAMFSGEKGDVGAKQYLTLVDLDLGRERDTWSYHLPPVEREVSSSTNDDGSYFVTNYVDLQRVDMAVGLSGDYSQAPNITGIAFTAPYLWHDDSAQIGITVSVTDSQGLGDIDTVTLAVLVEGVEEPIWSMPREPLAFPTGDPGATLLYDDGTHGDVTAGDGIFTFDAIATRKTDPITWNTWYSQFTLPHQVGVRIIAEDLGGNATIADTTLWITAVDTNPVIFADGFESGNTSGWSGTSP